MHIVAGLLDQISSNADEAQPGEGAPSHTE